MTLALLITVYAALPLTVTGLYWRAGRPVVAWAWFVVGAVAPALVFWAALTVLNAEAPAQRSSDEALDAVVTAGVIAAGAWSVLCTTGVILGRWARTRSRAAA